ncbi:uncharacterized protein LOC134711078 [Mytilus trossulus]|uniref:uncharacterized protein LOC134711078 n=1 Tax=Mytilus trossulus TaxID=6551 RepID=UPI003005DC2A
MAPLSDEESNYIRLALLLLGVSPRAVRLTNSSNFDVTLMILLIRNLTPVTPPLTGFDKLPTQAETSPESDLARIKWYRNILAHLNSDKIDTVFFNTAWGDIIEAVCRLGGKQMKDECQDLKVKILDQSNQELMNEIKNSQREIRELQDIINRLHNKVRRNCTSALDILGGQIKKQSNQEITIAIKKAEREIRELGDIIERFNNKLWRCQSCSDIKDLTGEEVKYERGNTQIVIDQTKDDSAEHEAGHMHTNYKLVDGLNGSNGSNESSPYAEFGEGVRTENRPGSMTTGDENEASSRITGYSRNRNETMEHRGFTDSGPFQTIPENSFNSTGEENEASRRITGYSKNWDGLMERRCFTDSGPFQTMPGDSLDSTGEENEATRRITGYSKNWDGLMERRCFTDSGPFQTMPGDSLDSVQAEIETTNQNTMQTNYQNEEGGNTYFGVQNIQEDSWDSVFTMADVTSSGFMLRPGIHVPTHRYDFPNFTDRRDIQPFQQQTVQEDIGPTNRNTTHNNHQNEETGQNYSGFDDIPGDSWDSIFTIPDMRPSGIISRPDIPDPISRYVSFICV